MTALESIPAHEGDQPKSPKAMLYRQTVSSRHYSDHAQGRKITEPAIGWGKDALYVPKTNSDDLLSPSRRWCDCNFLLRIA